MKNKLLLALTAAFFLTVPTQAGPRQALKSAFRAYGHQVRMEFVDVKRHPLAWGLYFGGEVAANAMDNATTCYGLSHHDFVETNVLLGQHPSCAHATAHMALFTFGVQLPVVHALSDKWTEHCYSEAADSNSEWNRLASKGLGSRNPESCRWNVPVAAMSEWGLHAVVIYNNVDLIERH